VTRALAPASVDAAALELLAKLAEGFAQAATSPATRRAYASDWRAFTTWCASTKLAALPATPDTLALYLGHLAQLGRSVSTIERARAAISVAHAAANRESPSKALVVKKTMEGIRRTVGVAHKHAKKALLEDDVARMIAAADGADARAARDRALIALGFAGAFRRAELVALDVADVVFVDEGAVVTIKRSKTDQEGHGRRVALPRESAAFEHLEAWAALRANALGRGKDGALFVALKGSTHGARLSPAAAADVVKKYAEKLGLDPSLFGGHSLRRGFVTTAARAGAHERAIMKQTGHRSTTVLRSYIEDAGLFEDNAVNDIWRKA